MTSYIIPRSNPVLKHAFLNINSKHNPDPKSFIVVENYCFDKYIDNEIQFVLNNGCLFLDIKKF